MSHKAVGWDVGTGTGSYQTASFVMSTVESLG
jgi:hypothetical protein